MPLVALADLPEGRAVRRRHLAGAAHRQGEPLHLERGPKDYVALQHAAGGLGSWPCVGAVREALDCTKVSLLHGPSDGAGVVDLVDDGADPDGERSAALHRPHDPSLPVSVAIAADRLDRRPVADLFELVPEPEFRRSADYADYARRAGLYHRLGFSAVRGGRRMAPFRVHLPEHAPPFNEADRAALLRIKPCLKHAVALQHRLQVGGAPRPRRCAPGFGRCCARRAPRG